MTGEVGFLPEPGPPLPGVHEEASTTLVIFGRAELEETVRWILREKKRKTGNVNIPRRVAAILFSFEHLLIKYPESESFSVSVFEREEL